MSGKKMMRSAGTTLMGTFLLVALAGCFEHKITVGAGASRAPVVYDHWEHFWLGGLIGETEIFIEEMCPSGNATIEAQQSFLNGLVAGLTAGIYTPTTLKIRCEDGRRRDFDLSEEDAQRIVLDERFLGAVEAILPERLDEVQVALEEQDR
jgi:hypothetical protein